LTLNRRFKASSDFSFNGKEALEKIQERKMAPCSKCGNGGYIIYFIDVNMPVMDGFQTVKAIK
jgi:CheY-like chemotaxis protein